MDFIVFCPRKHDASLLKLQLSGIKFRGYFSQHCPVPHLSYLQMPHPPSLCFKFSFFLPTQNSLFTGLLQFFSCLLPKCWFLIQAIDTTIHRSNVGLLCRYAIYFNGVNHWLGFFDNGRINDLGQNCDREIILSFDMSPEVFRIMRLPDEVFRKLKCLCFKYAEEQSFFCVQWLPCICCLWGVYYDYDREILWYMGDAWIRVWGFLDQNNLL